MSGSHKKKGKSNSPPGEEISKRKHPRVEFLLGLAMTFASVGYQTVVPVPNVIVGWLLNAFASVLFMLAFWNYVGWSRRVKLLATLFFFVIFAGVAIVHIRSAVRSFASLEVDPVGSFTLGQGGWKNITPVLVLNNGRRPAYSVFVKILIDGSSISAADITVEPDERQFAPVVDICGVGVQSDVLMWNFIDSSKRQSVLVRFFAILPRDTRRLMVYNKTNATGSAQAKLLASSEQPDSVMQSTDCSVAMGFKLPESGTVTSFHAKVVNPLERGLMDQWHY